MIKAKLQNAEQAAQVQIANLQRCNDNQRVQLEAHTKEKTEWIAERDRLWNGCRNLLGFLCYARKQAMPQSIINSTLFHDLPMLITGSDIGTPRSHGYAKYIDL